VTAAPKRGQRRPTATETLQQCVAAEHAAIWAYGIIGAHLEPDLRGEARATWDAHRARRDRLALLLRDRDAAVPASEPAYAPPFAVTEPVSARQLAAQVENAVAATYADLVLAADGDLRTFGARALQEAAVRAIRWGGTPEAFPGIAER
jgi:Domain of unknown function (DUF4439)